MKITRLAVTGPDDSGSHTVLLSGTTAFLRGDTRSGPVRPRKSRRMPGIIREGFSPVSINKTVRNDSVRYDTNLNER